MKFLSRDTDASKFPNNLDTTLVVIALCRDVTVASEQVARSLQELFPTALEDVDNFDGVAVVHVTKRRLHLLWPLTLRLHCSLRWRKYTTQGQTS